MRIFSVVLVAMCLAMPLSACRSGLESASQTLTPRLSPHTWRVVNRDGLTTVVAARTDHPRISEHTVLSRGTSRQRKLVTEIQLVRMTNANSGPVDSAGVVHPSMRNRLVWLVITRNPYPFISGPITSTPRPAQTAPSHTAYLWNAIDARNGKLLQAETFSSLD